MDKIKTPQNILSPYLPGMIWDWYRQAPPGARHTVSRHEGILACLDISGFTALTRRLSGDSREGPEILTSLINSLFGRIMARVAVYRGDIIKFAGDALWIYFPQADRLTPFFSRVLEDLAGINAGFEITGDLPLAVHAGAEWGIFHLASLGDKEFRLEVEPLGPMNALVQEACRRAGINELVTGPVLGKEILALNSGQLRGECFWLIDIPDSEPFAIDSQVILTAEEIPDIPGLEPYVPPMILEKIKALGKPDDLAGEFREVTVLFAAFDYLLREEKKYLESDLADLNGLLSRLYVFVRERMGHIARIDPGPDGHRLLILFGAPVHHEDDEINALFCAKKICDLAGSKFRVKLGLSSGRLYCGHVGSERRREYTVMGEAVNLAARLANVASWGDILFDNNLRQRLPVEVFSESRELDLKGIGDDVTCHKFCGVGEDTHLRQNNSVTVGQEKYRQRLDDLARMTDKGGKYLVSLYGDPGTGKSLLINRFLKGQNGRRHLIVECRASILFGHAWVARKIITGLYRLGADVQRHSLIDFVRRESDEAFWPLAAEMIGLEAEETPWMRGLSSQLRLAKARMIFSKLMAALCPNPVVVAIDDYPQADEYSRALIEGLSETDEEFPLLLILVSRTGIAGWSESAVQHSTLRLEVPAGDEWQNYFRGLFHDGKRERELVESLLYASRGNPQFIMEYISRAREDGCLSANPHSGKLELSETSPAPALPEKLGQMQLARFDLLPERNRSLLKAAAVAGPFFDEPCLQRTLPQFSPAEIKNLLQDNIKTGLLLPGPDEKTYQFGQGSLAEVIYDCLPLSQRQVWHAEIAMFLEACRAEAPAALLGHHFYQAGSLEKAFPYALRAATEASAKHSLNEAFHWFEICRDIVARRRAAFIPDDYYQLYRHYTELLIIDGRFGETYIFYRKWRRLARTDKNEVEYFSAAVKTAHVMWKQSCYRGCRRFLNLLILSGTLAPYPRLQAKALSIMGELERRAGNFGAARACCAESLKVAEKANDYQGMADAHNNLGLALWGEGKLAEAAAGYRKSLATAKSHAGGKFALAQGSNNLAIIYWEQGDFNAAESLLSEAHGIFRNLGDRRNEAYTAGNLSSLHRIAGKFSSARNLLFQADHVFQRLKDRHAHFYVLGNIGDLDMVEGGLEEADRNYRQVESFAAEVGDRELAAECQVRRGELAFFRNENAAAEEIFEGAITTAETIGSAEYAVRGKIGLARLLIGLRRQSQALNIIEEIALMARTAKSVLAESEASFLRSEHYRIAEDIPSAVAGYQAVLRYAKSQKIFETILKCSVRLFELDPDLKDSSSHDLQELAVQTDRRNNPGTWRRLMVSPYFQHFTVTLRALFPAGKL